MPYIQNTKNSIRTSIARARNHGSAKNGTHHWWMQRVTAIALIPLSLFMLACLNCLLSGSYEQTILWLSNPFVSVVLILFIISAFYHAALGMQVVIEDYIHHKAAKLFSLLSVKFSLFIMAVICIFSLLTIAFRTDPFAVMTL